MKESRLGNYVKAEGYYGLLWMPLLWSVLSTIGYFALKILMKYMVILYDIVLVAAMKKINAHREYISMTEYISLDRQLQKTQATVNRQQKDMVELSEAIAVEVRKYENLNSEKNKLNVSKLTVDNELANLDSALTSEIKKFQKLLQKTQKFKLEFEKLNPQLLIRVLPEKIDSVQEFETIFFGDMDVETHESILGSIVDIKNVTRKYIGNRMFITDYNDKFQYNKIERIATNRFRLYYKLNEDNDSARRNIELIFQGRNFVAVSGQITFSPKSYNLSNLVNEIEVDSF
ncbi:MAG: hypothetical protein V4635_08565 [Bacteroidota bacterium]